MYRARLRNRSSFQSEKEIFGEPKKRLEKTQKEMAKKET